MILAVMVVAALAQPTQQGSPAQGVAYRIEATLEEGTDILRGRGELLYTNRSATALDTLWVHEHLNAFRPNSAFARREMEFRVRRFQELGPADHAYQRLTRVEIDGNLVMPVYPGAPDSTVVGIPLPARLGAGQSVLVRLDWVARLATVPRRQGRSGRHFDWAHWYPRIAVYENSGWAVQPLLPQGEFYGEFGSYDVTLELASDQVVGATGIPVEGDPGWGGGALYKRDAYPASPAKRLGLLAERPPPGRKQIRWRAEDVHHFAWSADPRFVYEGGRVARTGPGGGDIAVHVLRLPGDADWARVALARSIAALQYLQGTFGPYPWPQFTNLHRLEPGGTEFPMLVMNGSPSEGLIVHEAVHQYLHGILANNEFREAWLDEGFTSYVTNRYLERKGNPNVWSGSFGAARERERAGATQPVALASADFVDPATYSAMSYTKAELIFRMLEGMIGPDRMDQVLRTFFARNALSRVNEADLRAAVNSVSGDNLNWFFDQWIHTTATLDYAIAGARSTPLPDGRWSTEVTVTRTGAAWMPVDLLVGESTVRLRSRETTQTARVITAARPSEAVLDPGSFLLEVNVDNNRAPVAGGR